MQRFTILLLLVGCLCYAAAQADATLAPLSAERAPYGTVTLEFGLWLRTVIPDVMNYLRDIKLVDIERVIRAELFNKVVIDAEFDDDDLDALFDIDFVERTRYSDAVYFRFYTNDPNFTDPLDYLTYRGPSLINNFSDFLVVNRELDLTSVLFPGNLTVLAMDITPIVKFPTELRERCEAFGFCGSIAHAECVDDGTNRARRRCFCRGPYVQIGRDQCFKRISYLHDAACAACEANDGVCYGEAATMTGCECPNSRSGDRCQYSFVGVTCTNDDMSVCVTPFNASYTDPWFGANFSSLLESANNWTSPLAAIHLKDRRYTPGCAFERVAVASPLCDAGSYLLTLSTHDADLGLCGLDKVVETGRLVYSATVIVATAVPLHDVDLLARCVFQLRFEEHAGIEVAPQLLGATATLKSAQVTMTILDRSGRRLDQGAQIYENDEIRIRFDMTDKEELFRAIAVEFCTATNHFATGPTGKSLPLIVDRCPAAGQSYLTDANTFRPVAGSLTSLITRPGGLRAFRLDGAAVYFHCTIRVCQQMVDCRPVECADASWPSYGRRKRRSASKNSLDIYTKFDVRAVAHDPSVKGNVSEADGNAIVVVSVTGLVCVAVFVAALVLAFRKKLPTKSESQFHSPMSDIPISDL